MILLLSDREQIASEFAILCDSYADDYVQLKVMFGIATDLCNVRDPKVLAKAYRTLCSKLVLIRQYDAEFTYASNQLYELLGAAEDVEWAE